MLTGLNSPYAHHTGVRGLPVPLWRFGISLLFGVVVGGRFIRAFFLTIANAALILTLLRHITVDQSCMADCIFF